MGEFVRSDPERLVALDRRVPRLHSGKRGFSVPHLSLHFLRLSRLLQTSPHATVLTRAP